jgi:hypothetical protein
MSAFQYCPMCATELQLISMQTFLDAYVVVEFVNTPALQCE